MSMPHLSVIIPTYNRADLLPQAIDSVLAQHFADYEIIVVDDGSTDDTDAAVSRFGDRVRFFRQNNQGAGLARNLGIRKARGQYLAFLDSDDLWFPWTMETIARTIQLHDRPAVLQTTIQWIDTADEVSHVHQEPLQSRAWPDVFTFARQLPLAGAGATVVRRDLALSAGGFPPERIVGEDIDFLLKLGTSGPFVLIESPRGFAYRRHNGMTTASAKAWYNGANFLLHQEKHGHYPGGRKWRAARKKLLANDSAYRSLVCLKAGAIRYGMDLYARTFALQLVARNFGYLFKTPFRAAMAAVGQWP